MAQSDNVREMLQKFFESKRWMSLNQFKVKDKNGKTHLFSYATLADELKNPNSEVTEMILSHVNVLDDLIRQAKEWKK